MRIVTIYTVVLLLIFAFLYFKPSSFTDRVHLETTEDEISYVNDLNLNPILMTDLMTDYLQTFELSSYLLELKETQYITPSYNPVIFQRDWILSQQLIYDEDSSITARGYFLKNDEDRYFVMLDYRMHYDPEAIAMSYLTINTESSLDYWVNAHTSSILIQNEEYEVGGTISPIVGNAYYFKPYSDLSTIHKAIYQGLMIIELSDIDDFLHLRIDFYEAVYQTSSYTLGFNQINAGSQIKYIPQSLELIYEREE